MTLAERNLRIMRAIEELTRIATALRETAREMLCREGIYTPDGHSWPPNTAARSESRGGSRLEQAGDIVRPRVWSIMDATQRSRDSKRSMRASKSYKATKTMIGSDRAPFLGIGPASCARMGARESRSRSLQIAGRRRRCNRFGRMSRSDRQRKHRIVGLGAPILRGLAKQDRSPNSQKSQPEGGSQRRSVAEIPGLRRVAPSARIIQARRREHPAVRHGSRAVRRRRRGLPGEWVLPKDPCSDRCQKPRMH